MNFKQNKKVIVGIFGLLALIGVAVITLISCKSKKEYAEITPNLVSTSEILQAFEDAKITTRFIYIPDEEYYLVTEDWVKQMYEEFVKDAFYSKTLLYRAGGNDCDDFADYCRVFAKRYFNLNSKVKLAITFGEFAYRPSFGDGHVINVFLIKKDNKIQIKFLEPQSGNKIELKDLEKKDSFICYFIRIG